MTALQSLCAHCEAPFDPVPYELPGIGGTVIHLMTELCPNCAKTAALEQAAASRAALDLRAKPLSSLLPTPGAPRTVECRVCKQPFETETAVFAGDKTVREKTTFPTVCDACAAMKPAAPAVRPAITDEDRRRKMWVGMTGIRYSEFNPDELPAVIRPHVQTVMAWKPQPQGIGLVGPSRAGKSPLLYALGQSLFVAGHGVFPTTGIEFQRKYQRSFDKDETYAWADYLKACERTEILLLDDADKLNLTAGVEAEYYGMLEMRRNWQLPILCTLNLTGAEFAALGRDRSDRAAAIVERLRDLCTFIPVS